MFQAYVCDAITGAVLDRVAVSDFTWERLLSAGGSGKVTIPIDDTYSKSQLRTLTQHWSTIWALESDRGLEYMGYVTNRGYKRGSHSIELGLSDLWGLLPRRGAWDHSAPHVEDWSTTATVSLAQHAANALIRGRDTGPSLPKMGIPVTIPGFGGTAYKRTWYGYHVQTVDDVFQDLMSEGLDVFFEPRWVVVDGQVDWLMRAGPSWGSGTVHEFSVTAAFSQVNEFSESGDGSRITNNARYVGEGSERDMLVRSSRNTASSYPLLDRITSEKQVDDVAALARMASNDLSMYAQPTFQWDFSVPIDEGVQVGDTVRLLFDGDPWITDGWHTRRVVKVSGGMKSFVNVSLQPIGGA